VRTSSAAHHSLCKCKDFPELPPAERLDLVREYSLCEQCLSGYCGKKCKWRNQIRDELCQEQSKCRRSHQLQAAKWTKLAEPPCRPTESPACGNTRTAVAGAMLAQMVSERGETEKCVSPQPWEEEYNNMPTVEEDSQLKREFEQMLGNLDLDDDLFDDHSSPQHFYMSW
jgi:hypothetical protein